MNQTHFLNQLFQKIQTGKRKGQLRDIRFRKRPDKYNQPATRLVTCRDCGSTVAEVSVRSRAISGLCLSCKHRSDEILREALIEKGLTTRTERRAYIRNSIGGRG